MTLSEPWRLVIDKPIWVGGHDLTARRFVESRLPATLRPPEGPISAAFITPETADEAAYFAAKVRGRLLPDGLVIVVGGAGSDCVTALRAPGALEDFGLKDEQRGDSDCTVLTFVPVGTKRPC